ncbi:DUF3800 domain-containing protein [Aerococcus sanguinicola]|uniref:DUF3800 domain-containing protein n=1 Tax=unclassified Aerococcus TaxID=2618060 RepID=UPI0008A40D6C|nr:MULTISPECIES: DUF3800 domain-containing protein [unclassified Aerococcus]KAB0646693.1 DUF3800 domain-containing protein [Aerococcus sanguinicola]MDK6233836.1 DUF3800 domain-containing protein [Aerococcus sp. UMB10185]MDK6856333.1 DUF3800 domain-containing protein [Aerococcus sp. UMB7533]MDK8503198.1 DUF3800 domain-containing protein [Aerococcus sp. UMB1112A]OFN04663.1 hypothetical protein HMPREF2626_04445 [Aerococcus sp. HMSC062A02]
MQLFVDESGSINRKKNPDGRYFVMAFVQTDRPDHVAEIFRRNKQSYLDKSQSKKTADEEIKGSNMPDGMKAQIFKALRDETDAVFHYLVIDNFQVYPNLLRKPSLTFNYFVGLAIKEIAGHRQNEKENLQMMIDNRNQALRSLNSLEEYLQIIMTIEKRWLHDVHVEYKDSQDENMIQVADIFANTVFRVCRSEAHGKSNPDNKNLLKLCRIGKTHFFPSGKSELSLFE